MVFRRERAHVRPSGSLHLIDIDRALSIYATEPWGFRHSMSNGSFSKIVAPGVRTGRIDTAPAMLVELMGHGWLKRHIMERLVPAYMKQRMVKTDAVERKLGRLGRGVADVHDVRLVGGFSIRVRLPSRVRATDVAGMAREEENLMIAPRRLFGVMWDELELDFDGFSRLSFSHEDESSLVEGVRRLRKVIERILHASV